MVMTIRCWCVAVVVCVAGCRAARMGSPAPAPLRPLSVRDYETDRVACLSAAELGDVRAQYLMGTVHAVRADGSADGEAMVEWLRRAAGQGFAPAEKALATVLLKQNPDATDAAASWLGRAANEGDVAAMVRLGKLRAKQGRAHGEEALQWLVRAAESGSVEAAFLVGRLRYDGEIVERDYSEAVGWTLMAAESGHTEAQCDLGLALARGHGLVRDPAEAAKWFRIAAMKGLPRAQRNLGALYQNGEGVEKDWWRGYAWMVFAAEQGDPNARRFRSLAEERMTRQEKTAAQRAVAQLREELEPDIR